MPSESMFDWWSTNAHTLVNGPVIILSHILVFPVIVLVILVVTEVFSVVAVLISMFSMQAKQESNAKSSVKQESNALNAKASVTCCGVKKK